MAAIACPHCGHESEEEVCPLCGTDMPAGGERSSPGSAGRDVSGRSATSPGDGGPVAWEDPGLGFPLNAWRSWRESLLEPTSFFRRIDHGASMARPILYFLLVSVTGAFFHLVWQAYLYVPMMGQGAAYGGDAYVIQFFAAPFVVLVGLGFQTLILHLFVLMLAPERRGMGSTARVICYASGPALLSIVPFVGALAGGIWGLVLQVVGIREAHRTSTGRAVVVVLAPVILAFLAAVLLMVLFALAMGGGELASGSPPPVPLPLP